MPLPDYQSAMLSMLKTVKNSKEQSLRRTTDILAKKFKLIPEEKNNFLQALIKKFT